MKNGSGFLARPVFHLFPVEMYLIKPMMNNTSPPKSTGKPKARRHPPWGKC
jgi:hypothetical protein